MLRLIKYPRKFENLYRRFLISVLQKKLLNTKDITQLVKIASGVHKEVFKSAGAKSDRLSDEGKSWVKEQAKLIHKAERDEKNRLRAEMIARNELGNLYAKETIDVAQRKGIKTYIWITKQDSRVRKSHQAKHGKRFKIGDSPMPGEEWNCRCHALLEEV